MRPRVNYCCFVNHILTLQYGTAYLVLHIHRHVHLAHLFACLFDGCALSDASENITYVGDRKWPIMDSSIARGARVQDLSKHTRCHGCVLHVHLYVVRLYVASHGAFHRAMNSEDSVAGRYVSLQCDSSYLVLVTIRKSCVEYFFVNYTSMRLCN